MAIITFYHTLTRVGESSAASSAAGATPGHSRSAGEPRPVNLPGDPGDGLHDQDEAGSAARRPAAALLEGEAAAAARAAAAGAPRQRRHPRQDRGLLAAALLHQPQEGLLHSRRRVSLTYDL